VARPPAPSSPRSGRTVRHRVDESAWSGHGRRTRRGSCFCGCPSVPRGVRDELRRRDGRKAKPRKWLGPPALTVSGDWAGGEKAAVATPPLAGPVWGRPSAGGTCRLEFMHWRPGRGWACEASGPSVEVECGEDERSTEPRRTRVKRAGGCARGAICPALGARHGHRLSVLGTCAQLRAARPNASGPGVKPCISHTCGCRPT
jgi:hypothetical protein